MSTATELKAERKTYSYVQTDVYPIATGEYLEERLEELNMSADEFSEKTGLPLMTVLLFIKGVVPLTEKLARILEASTHVPANNWLRQEKRYRTDLALAAQKYRI